MSTEPINLDDRLADIQSNTESEPIVLDPQSTENVDNVDTTEEGSVSEESTETNETQEDITEENSEGVEDTSAEGTETPISEMSADVLDGDAPSSQPSDTPTEYKFKDDFIKKAVEYYETYGTLTPYLEATQVNYDEMDDVSVMKRQFDKENADLPEKTRNRLFEKSLEKYNLDSYEEEDIEIGQALLKRDANKLRAALKDEQQQFVNSIQRTQEPEVSQEDLAQQQAEARQNIQAQLSTLVKDNMIKVEAEGTGINYQLPNAQNVVEYAVDPTKFLSSFTKGDGNVDWQKWTMAVAFTENPTQFINELIKHGKSLGRKAMEAELKNAAPLTSNKDVIETPDIGTPQDDPVGFLRGMKVMK